MSLKNSFLIFFFVMYTINPQVNVKNCVTPVPQQLKKRKMCKKSRLLRLFLCATGSCTFNEYSLYNPGHYHGVVKVLDMFRRKMQCAWRHIDFKLNHVGEPYSLPKSFIFSRIGSNFIPLSVNEYSTRGGTSGKTSRLITPSLSNSLSCFVREP